MADFPSGPWSGLQGGHIGTAQENHEEHDHEAGRKRVATWTDGNSAVYGDAAFISGSSPTVIDAFADLGRAAHGGFILNDGPGDLKVELSNNGTNYGGMYTMRDGEVFVLDQSTFRKIRLTYVDDTEYRVMIN